MNERAAVSILRITADAGLPVEAGGKALGLRSILRAGLHVPPAWVVLPSAGDEALRGLGRDLAREGIAPLAVRSSAADEDGARSSFAGIHESLLGVAPEDLLAAVRQVAASPLSERAGAYRREMGLPPAPGPCGVVVQALVAADRSGVAFGAGPESGVVVVEAVEGLGERLVQGLETPEAWQLERAGASWRVRRRRSRRQNHALLAGDRRCRTAGRLGEAAVAPVLTEETATRVAEGVMALQASAGGPLDVEWCMEGDRISFVQSRPRTRPLDALPPGQTWTRSNFREVLPEIASGLTRSYVLACLRAGMRRYMAPFAPLLPRDTELVECVHGRFVFNDTASGVLLERLGIPRRLMDVTLGGGDGGPDRFEPMLLRRQARHPVIMARALWRSLRTPRRTRRLIEWFRQVREAAVAAPFGTLGDHELLPWIEAVPLELGEQFAFASMLVVAYLQNVQHRIAGMLRALPHPGAAITRLAAPGLRTVSTRMTDELIELARAFRRWEGGAAFLADPPGGQDGPGAWRERLPAALFESVADWIARHEHRGPYESDLASTRYGDDWGLLAGLLAPLVLAKDEPESPSARHARLEREAAAAWEEVRGHLGPLGRRTLRGLLKGLGRLLALREELRSTAIAAVYKIRVVFVEAGHRLARRGRIASWDDVWALEMTQVARALVEPDFDAATAVARERGRLAAWRRVEVPNRFRSEDLDSPGPAGAAEPEAGVLLTGTGIGPGLAEGRARLLETPWGGDALRAGEILVAPTTDPGWTPLFARAGGVVVEMGGTLSHAGIVAREFGIPCVANVDDAMRRIRDGQLLRIDGTQGTVRIEDEPEPVPSTGT